MRKNIYSKFFILFSAASLYIVLATASLFAQDQQDSTNSEEYIEETFITNGFGEEIKLLKVENIKSFLEEGFQSYETYQADFKEIYLKKVRKGKIYIEKPYFLRIQYFYKDILEMDVFSDDKILYVHLSPYNLVYEQDLLDANDVLYEETPPSLSLLSEKYNFNFIETKERIPIFADTNESQRFAIDSLEPEDTELLAYHMFLQPKDITEGIDQLEIWITEDKIIRRMKATSVQKITTELFFYNVTINEPIPVLYQEFIIKPGVKTLKNKFWSALKKQEN